MGRALSAGADAPYGQKMRRLDAPGHGTTWSGPRAARVHRSDPARSRQSEAAQRVKGASIPRIVHDGRVVLRVNDLPTSIETLTKAGIHFRNDMETGHGGKQIQLADPDGNPIELFEPAR